MKFTPALTIGALMLLATVAAEANAPPVIQLAEVKPASCTSQMGAHFFPDARASYDPDGDAVSFSWTGPWGVTFETGAQSATPHVIAKLGNRSATLTVSDGASSVSVPVHFEVRDTVAPTTVLYVFGDQLSNGWYHDDTVWLEAEAWDTCDANACGAIRLTGTWNSEISCGRMGIIRPGEGTIQHWGRDTSGNIGPVVDGGSIVIVDEFRSDITVDRPSSLEGSVEVFANFDRLRGVQGAQVTGIVQRVGAPSAAAGFTSFAFSGTTGPDGMYRVELPPRVVLPGDYVVTATSSTDLGFTATQQVTYSVPIVPAV